jgi:hypothetical protein
VVFLTVELWRQSPVSDVAVLPNMETRRRFMDIALCKKQTCALMHNQECHIKDIEVRLEEVSDINYKLRNASPPLPTFSTTSPTACLDFPDETPMRDGVPEVSRTRHVG